MASALNQSYSNIEVLVSDNASTDDTLAMLKSINDKRLRVLVNKENIGLTPNWNKCVHEAAGDYFTILSDDNVLRTSFLRKCIDLLRIESDLPIIAGSYDVIINGENRVIPAVLTRQLHTGIWCGTEILKERYLGNFACATLSCLVRTKSLRRNGAFPIDHDSAGEEMLLGRLFLEGRAGLINEPCASYLFHTHSTAMNSAEIGINARLQDMRYAMEDISNVAAHRILDKDTRQEIQRLTKTFLMYMTIQELAFDRREGARLIDVMRSFAKSRHLLVGCTAADFLRTARLRSIGRILLPPAVIRFGHALGIF